MHYYTIQFFSVIFLTIARFALFQCTNSYSKKSSEIEIQATMGYDILNIIKRPITVYTQGLFFDHIGKHLYESGGLYGKSTIKKLKYPSLEVEYASTLSPQFFAEGIAKCGETIYQLTWQENVILKYDADDLESLGRIRLDPRIREGWGFSEYKDNKLIATDGSSNIYIVSCSDMKVKDLIKVTLNKIAVERLNDLIYANDFIYANKYFDNKIYKIDPNSGEVIKTYDMQPLIDYEIKKNTLSYYDLNMGNVLNGIAYDKNKDVFLITGKMWGYFYELKFDQ